MDLLYNIYHDFQMIDFYVLSYVLFDSLHDAYQYTSILLITEIMMGTTSSGISTLYHCNHDGYHKLWNINPPCFSFVINFLCCPITCHYVLMSVTMSAYKRCSVRLYLQLFVGGLMSYLRYLCLFQHSGVQHILSCVLFFVFFVLCALCCQFLWIVHFVLPLRYSLTFYKMD